MECEDRSANVAQLVLALAYVTIVLSTVFAAQVAMDIKKRK